LLRHRNRAYLLIRNRYVLFRQAKWLHLVPYNFVFVPGTVKGTFLVITLDKTSHVVFIHIDGAVVRFVLFIIFIVCTKITTGHTKVPLLL